MLTTPTVPSLVSRRVLGALFVQPRGFSSGAIYRHSRNSPLLGLGETVRRGCMSSHYRLFSTSRIASSASLAKPESAPNDLQKSESSSSQTKPTPPAPSQRSVLSRILPSSFLKGDSVKSASSFKKIIALAKPERKPLGIAIGLLLISSSVSMSVPFTIGKLIDYFTSANPVSSLLKYPFVFYFALSGQCIRIPLWCCIYKFADLG